MKLTKIIFSIITTIVIIILIQTFVVMGLAKIERPVISPIPENYVPEIPTPTPTPRPKKQALASYYVAVYDGVNCDDPKCIMANGKPYDELGATMACASRFQLGTRIRLSHQGKETVATCTDRGAFEKKGRLFDLSKGVFSRLASLKSGVIQVDYVVLDY